ncbi:carbohydrate-binding protein [Micromonospora radicis]|uniref:CBM6 domain-containing protein n=1 Tax=Micromonospora radicis TaxID=1894971 RepID=A0A418MYN8_9ACTN|nr:hypothetical protein [Micromonospora radicis]RIV40197.1 hypothetical protein D2L64_04860 [Micromonospora radicis]
MPNETGSADADPIPRILGSTPPKPDRSTRTRQWVGIGTLTGAIALAAIAIPPLLATDETPPSGASETVDAPAPPSGAPEPAAATPDDTPAATVTPPARPSYTPTMATPDPQPPTSTTAPDTPPTTTAPAPAGTSRSATPAAPPPITVQAEDPDNLLGDGARMTACAACDGGARVRYLGTLTAYLDNPTAGRRTVTVDYTVNGDRELKISINGAAPTSHIVTGTDWNIPRTLRYTATVPAGRVSFTFFNDTGPSPDIDKLTIS